MLKIPNPIDINVLKELQDLQDSLRYHDVMREVFKIPQIEPIDYQLMESKFTQLTKAYPYETTRLTKARSVAEQLRTFGEVTNHDFPVLEYRPASSLTHIKNWLDRIDGNYDTLITTHYEGCRIELVYKGGALHKAVSKGGGILGLDITVQAYLIQGIPQYIPETERVSIRGVVTADRGELEGLDIKRSIARAMMSFTLEPDSLGLKDELVFIPDEVNVPGTTLSTKELRSILLLWNFYVPAVTTFKANRKELGYLEELIESVDTNSLFPVNGLLFILDDIGRKLELGYTSIHPEWALLLERNIKNGSN